MFYRYSEESQDMVASVIDKELMELTAQVLSKQSEITRAMISVSDFRTSRGRQLKDEVSKEEPNHEMVMVLSDNYASTDRKLRRMAIYRARIESALFEVIEEKKRADELTQKIIGEIRANIDVVTDRYAVYGIEPEILNYNKERVDEKKSILQRMLGYDIASVGDGTIDIWSGC